MEAVFELIRSINPIQPLTADAWSFPDGKLNFKNDIMEIEKRALELSDVITYHFYGDYDNSVKVIEQLKNNQGKFVRIEYIERYGTFSWWGNSNYYITKVSPENSSSFKTK